MKKEILSKEEYIRPELKRIAMFGETGTLQDQFSIISSGDEDIHSDPNPDDSEDDNRAHRYSVWETW